MSYIKATVVGVAIISICVVLLYDRGGHDSPEGATVSALEDRKLIGKALSEGKPVRVELYVDKDPEKVTQRTITYRPDTLDALQRETMRKALDRSCALYTDAANRAETRPIESADPSDVHKAARMRADSLLARAAKLVLERGGGFLVGDGPYPENDQYWRYWNCSLPRAGKTLWGYVPVSLEEFPEVRVAYERAENLRIFILNEQVIKWNQLPLDERQRQFDQAAKVRDTLRELYKDLNKTVEQGVAGAEDRKSIAAKTQALEAELAKIPRGINRRTFLAPMRDR